MNMKRVLLCMATAASLSAVAALADDSMHLTHVPFANSKVAGFGAADALSPEIRETAVAKGATRLENPAALTDFYGYFNNGPMLPAPGDVQTPGHNVEASKSEPDKNTYLVLHGLRGADPGYDYGKRFLFQGHELSVNSASYVTRINLDADAAHRVTLLATTDVRGQPLPGFDGSTWYPFSMHLLFSQEGNGTTNGGIWQATPDFPSVAEDLLGVFGRGGYEGVQADCDGNVWVVEDIGGATVAGARLPNSFVYRLIPKNSNDLRRGGKYQALQVMSKANPGQPIAFQTASALTQDIKDLHTFGFVFDTKWITIHDTDVDGFAPFNANALAKAKLATPFKRPENGQFRPGAHFREFVFDETGDTSATSTANAAHGGFGSLMKLTQKSPSADTGTLTLFFSGDPEHAAFDNVAFFDEHRVIAVEDRGDGLHSQGNALDSAWLFDTRLDYADPDNKPVRILAQGRDASAVIDSALGSIPGNGFQNDGDNEITGIHVSDGDPTVHGLLGARVPQPFRGGWRVFYTGQHGENTTYEIIPNRQQRVEFGY